MKNKRVLMLSSIRSSVLQFMTRDMAHGFSKLGWEVEVLRERWPGEGTIQPNVIVETVLHFRPDIVFSVDYMRAQNPELWPIGPKYVAWIQDALPHLLAWRHENPALSIGPWFGKDDLVLTSFPGLSRRFADAGFPEAQVKHLGVGVNEDMFFVESGHPQDFTVGFPANIGHPGHGNPQERYEAYAEPVRWLIEAGVKVKLWGEGWQNPEFGAFWQGLVRNGPELRAAYNSCSAILMVNRDTGNHQRVFEAAACGRRVLAKRLPNDGHANGIDACNVPLRHAFSTKDELIALCKSLPEFGFPVQKDISDSVAPHTYTERAKAVIQMAEEMA